MKCLTLALSDGKSCYPINFSLHREKGKKKDYGLTLKQRKEQFKEKRNAKNPDYTRKAECDESKLEMARRMLCHAVGHGINFKYVLAKSWFTCESLIQAVRELCGGYLGLGKCHSRSYNAQIADTTLCFMMYQMLSLAKRSSEYETLGALSVPSVTGYKCSPCGAGLWKKSGICWKFCRVKQEWICWHAYQL